MNAENLAILSEAIERFATPFYLFDEGEIHRHVAHLLSLLAPGVQLAYAMKANSFVLAQAARDVERIEVCSPGEARICIELGIPDEKIVISGVYKDPAFIGELVREHPQIGHYWPSLTCSNRPRARRAIPFACLCALRAATSLV